MYKKYGNYIALADIPAIIDLLYEFACKPEDKSITTIIKNIIKIRGRK